MSREDANSIGGSLPATMTVFMGMTILMILSIFFSLLEVLHYVSLREESVMLSKIGIESMFADYCRPMWDEYGILGIDGGYGGESFDMEMMVNRMEEYLADNVNVGEFSRGGNHLSLSEDQCAVMSYGLMTDKAGAPFMKECAEAAMYGLPESLLDGLTEQADFAADGQMDWEDMLEAGDDAYQEALEEKQAGQENEDGTEDDQNENGSELTAEEMEEIGNPIEMVLEWKDEGILKQVVSMDAVSAKKLTSENRVSVRRLAKGNSKEEPVVSPADRLLFQYYLSESFSSYTHPKERKGLSYELEYVIGGEDSDKENLAETVERLLVYRGAMNLISFPRGGDKTAKTQAVAAALAAAVANPLIEPVLTTGVTAAWVYAESVLDVRTLLRGGKVAVIKSPEEWTSDLYALGACLDMDYRARESNSGVDYQSCLIAMLTMVSHDKVGLRALDVIENELRQLPDYRNVKLDNFVYCGTASFGYKANPVFGSLVTVGRKPGGYSFVDEESMNYIK